MKWQLNHPTGYQYSTSTALTSGPSFPDSRWVAKRVLDHCWSLLEWCRLLLLNGVRRAPELVPHWRQRRRKHYHRGWEHVRFRIFIWGNAAAKGALIKRISVANFMKPRWPTSVTPLFVPRCHEAAWRLKCVQNRKGKVSVQLFVFRLKLDLPNCSYIIIVIIFDRNGFMKSAQKLWHSSLLTRKCVDVCVLENYTILLSPLHLSTALIQNFVWSFGFVALRESTLTLMVSLVPTSTVPCEHQGRCGHLGLL